MQAFSHLLVRLREGDDNAAHEIYEQFGDHIRRLSRVWLSRRKLGRLMDSEDICQSVLGDFFNRYKNGEYSLSEPKHLRALLSRIATSRLLYHWERHRAAKRDLGRMEENAFEDALLHAHRESTASDVLAGKEVVAECQKILSAKQWRLVVMRNEGASWKTIAHAFEKTDAAVRMEYSRAIAHVANRLFGKTESN